MSTSTGERLYNLLPAVYGIRDADEGYPLRALLGAIEDQVLDIEEDIENLLENWFIETCADWVVPYIGDLLAARPLLAIGPGTVSHRSYVANTIAYRRRKGTAAILEQLARDVSAWPARVVEFFQLLATTQYLNHLRPENLRTPDLRDTKRLELLGGPFETIAHTLDARSIAARRGRYNIPNIGLFLWRLQSYPIEPSTTTPEGRPGRGTARGIDNPADGRYTFNPLGLDAPLFNRPRTEKDISHLAEEINVPAPLRHRPLYDELESLRRANVAQQQPPSPVYFGDHPVLEIYLEADADPVPPEQIIIGELSSWRRPPSSKTYEGPNGDVQLPIRVALDPALGRITLAPGETTPAEVLVSYSYGFSADLGGGPYERRESVEAVMPKVVDYWEVSVTKEEDPGPLTFVTLAEAVDEWNAQPQGTDGVIAIRDSRTYDEAVVPTIVIPSASQLLIVAAGASGESASYRSRPHLLGDLSVRAEEGAKPNGSALILNGLLIEGQLKVEGGNLERLHLAHCTLVPAEDGLVVSAPGQNLKRNANLRIQIERTVCGPISLAATVPELTIVDSIVDAGTAAALSAPGTTADIQKSTVFGETNVRRLEAGNSIFTDLITVAQRQAGCVRFCYLPDERPGADPDAEPVRSRTPRRYACQPDLALIVGEASAAAAAHIRLRMAPAFTSIRYGDAAYAQLSLTCPIEIRTGAEDGSEMGVFSHLRQPQRESNLLASLDEYVRFGQEVGLFYVT